MSCMCELHVHKGYTFPRHTLNKRTTVFLQFFLGSHVFKHNHSKNRHQRTFVATGPFIPLHDSLQALAFSCRIDKSLFLFLLGKGKCNIYIVVISFDFWHTFDAKNKGVDVAIEVSTLHFTHAESRKIEMAVPTK